MAEPQPKNTPRKKSRGNTLHPFPIKEASILKAKNPKWQKDHSNPFPQAQKATKKPTSTKGIESHSVKHKKIRKSCINAFEHIGKSTADARKEIEIELVSLFDFLEDEDFAAKMGLVEKFNQKIESGEIKTTQDMNNFLKKAEELADCLRLYVQRNEYCANFGKEISFEEFEEGFPRDKRQDIRSKYSDYFS